MKSETIIEFISRRGTTNYMMSGSGAGLLGMNYGNLSDTPDQTPPENIQSALLNKFKAGKPIFET